ncbi:MAG: hypothetical protein RLZZ618_2164 [Pseudomonadota bacterium]|jgi:phosphinothricin acetyltransferase
MKLVHCTHDRHAVRILEVLNEAIVMSTALFDYQPRTADSMVAWFKAKEEGGFPVIGLEDDSGVLLGFASYGTFRAWPAYKYSVEHSVYVHKDHRARGVGRLLMQELIRVAETRHVHLLIGGIEATNAGSIALHEAIGFSHSGTIRQAGFKFGRWLDLSFYQLTLRTPAQPDES